MKNTILASALLALGVGCAATTASSDAIQPRAVQMVGDFEAKEAARYTHLADTDRDGSAEAELRVCVAPTGQVADTRVLRSSGSSEFDSAVTRDVTRARYRAFSAPAETKVCNDLRLVINEG